MFKKLFTALAVTFFAASPAQAALKFQYRSDSNTQSFYAAGWRDMGQIYTNTGITLTTTAIPGVFGGKYLDMSNTGATQNLFTFPGGDNCPLSTNGFSLHMRVIPVNTGNPTSGAGLFSFGSLRDWVVGAMGGLSASINLSSQFCPTAGKSNSTGSGYFNGGCFSTPLSFTANQPTDIWFTWDGSATAGHAKLYQNQNGATAALVDTLTAGAVQVASSRAACAGMITMDLNQNFPNANQFHINEIEVWDDAENPVSYGTLTTWIPPPGGVAFEGNNYTALPASNVTTGTAYGPGPGSLSGTYNPIVALAATTKHGTTASDGTGTYFGADWCSDPGVNFVRSSASYLSGGSTVSGAYVIPTTFQVQNAVTYGVAGASVGRLVCTQLAAHDVVNGVAYTNYAGDFTGNFNPPCTSVPPSVEDVIAGTVYTIDGIGYVGTSIMPPVNKVQRDYAFDDGATLGTLDCTALPTNQVAESIPYTNYTGAHTGVLAFINNLLAQAVVVANGSAGKGVLLDVTQGDTATLQFAALQGYGGTPFDLTGAQFTTYIRSASGTVSFADGKHTVIDAASGTFTLTLSSSDTASLKLGGPREVVIKIVQGSSTTYFHGLTLHVLSSLPGQ